MFRSAPPPLGWEPDGLTNWERWERQDRASGRQGRPARSVSEFDDCALRGLVAGVLLAQVGIETRPFRPGREAMG